MYKSQNEYTSMSGNQNRFLGRAAEHRVISELLLRDINCSEIEVDDGIDLMTINGYRIQIKSSRSTTTTTKTYRYPVYLFSLRKKKYVNSKNKTLRPKIKANKIDFLILWCVDHNWFYIIPEENLTQTTINIPIRPLNPSKYEKFLSAWDLLKEGRD